MLVLFENTIQSIGDGVCIFVYISMCINVCVSVYMCICVYVYTHIYIYNNTIDITIRRLYMCHKFHYSGKAKLWQT